MQALDVLVVDQGRGERPCQPVLVPQNEEAGFGRISVCQCFIIFFAGDNGVEEAALSQHFFDTLHRVENMVHRFGPAIIVIHGLFLPGL